MFNKLAVEKILILLLLITNFIVGEKITLINALIETNKLLYNLNLFKNSRILKLIKFQLEINIL